MKFKVLMFLAVLALLGVMYFVLEAPGQSNSMEGRPGPSDFQGLKIN